MAADTSQNVTFYGRFLLFIAGMGGLLYGIIAAAALYLEKTINLTVEQSSFNVAAVLGGEHVFLTGGRCAKRDQCTAVQPPGWAGTICRTMDGTIAAISARGL